MEPSQHRSLGPICVLLGPAGLAHIWVMVLSGFPSKTHMCPNKQCWLGIDHIASSNDMTVEFINHCRNHFLFSIKIQAPNNIYIRSSDL